jgi:hypothetical protein
VRIRRQRERKHPDLEHSRMEKNIKGRDSGWMSGQYVRGRVEGSKVREWQGQS